MKPDDEHKKYNLKLFKKWAPIYDKFAFFITPLRIVINRLSDLPQGSKVLDVACGTGTQAIRLAKKGFEVVGVDLSPDMLKVAKKKVKKGLNIKFLCHDATQLPFKNDHFDLSTISFALHDMPEEIAVDVLKEMKRVTKPKGKIIIGDYNKAKNKPVSFVSNKIFKLWESKYFDHFMKTGLENYLKKAGLKISSKKLGCLGNFQVVTCY